MSQGVYKKQEGKWQEVGENSKIMLLFVILITLKGVKILSKNTFQCF